MASEKWLVAPLGFDCRDRCHCLDGGFVLVHTITGRDNTYIACRVPDVTWWRATRTRRTWK